MTKSLLANPVWHALNGAHAPFAEVHGRARRYRRDVSVFSAVDTLDDTAWDDLTACADDTRGGVLIIRDEPPSPAPGWNELARFDLDQMVATSIDEPATAATWRDLGPSDVAAMVELVALTEPGPFVPGTPQFGGYVGVFDGERLVAMAGQRMQLPGYTEVSAVCTHPDARGQGLGAVVTAAVAARIIARGERAFLHVRPVNEPAKALYERLGFRVAQQAQLAIYAKIAS